MASFRSSSTPRTTCAKSAPARNAAWRSRISRTCARATRSSATGWRRCSARSEVRNFGLPHLCPGELYRDRSDDVRRGKRAPDRNEVERMSRGQHREPASGPSQRQLRGGEAVRHAVSELLAHGEVHDAVIETHLITVPEVRMSPDLRLATIYVMPLGGRDEAEVLAALDRNKRYVRGVIARKVNLKFAPDIRFRIDERFGKAERIEQLLRSPAVKRDLAGGSDDEH